ncbi:MAG: tetratricopeptide repeat protein [Planctomycetes bacterium]|nr:tetratricopeptide repeat protein [Planctomycetota bacterium]
MSVRPSSPIALLLALALCACGDERPVETFDPGPVEAAIPEVVSALADGRPDQALELIAARRRQPDPPEGLDLFEGMALIDAGRPAEAEAALARELDARPGNGQAHMLLAEQLIVAGRLDEARAHLEQAGAHGADPVYLALLRGRLALDTDDDETAKRAFRDFLQGDRYSARAAEAHHALAQIAEREGDQDSAASHRRTSEHLEQVAQFLNLYRERLEADPADVDATLGVGMIYLDLFVNMGGEAQMSKQAAAAFRAVLGRDPQNVKALFNLGFLRSIEGRFEEAEHDWERVIAIDPGHSGSLLNLGRLALRNGAQSAAEGRFREALDGADDDDERSQAHLELATLLEQQGRLAEALEHFEAALTLRPGAPQDVLDHVAQLRAQVSG